MKNKIKTLLLLSIITVFSCSKDDKNSEQKPYLTSYSFSFTSEEFQLNYNANNKLIAFETSDPGSSSITKINNEIIRNATGVITGVGNASFTYNSSNQITEINDGTGNGVTQLQYDAQGRLINQNTTYFGGSINETKNVTYDSSNRITKIIVHVVGATTNVYYKYILTYNTHNNIDKSVISSSSDGITYNVGEINNYTYDNKANPLKTISDSLGFSNFYIAPSFQFNQFSTANFNYIAAYKLSWISNNNVTNVESTYTSGGGNNTAYNYTYDEYGNPTKVVITDDEDGTYSQNFFYTIK